MKKIIPLLLAAQALTVSAARAQDAARPATVRPFPDVPPGHWAARAVEQLHQLGIAQGYPAVAPDKSVSTLRAPAPPARVKAIRPRARGRRQTQR